MLLLRRGFFKCITTCLFIQSWPDMACTQAHAQTVGCLLHETIPLKDFAYDDGAPAGEVRLGLHGAVQKKNAALAVALSNAWMARAGHGQDVQVSTKVSLGRMIRTISSLFWNLGTVSFEWHL